MMKIITLSEEELTTSLNMALDASLDVMHKKLASRNATSMAEQIKAALADHLDNAKELILSKRCEDFFFENDLKSAVNFVLQEHSENVDEWKSYIDDLNGGKIKSLGILKDVKVGVSEGYSSIIMVSIMKDILPCIEKEFPHSVHFVH